MDRIVSSVSAGRIEQLYPDSETAQHDEGSAGLRYVTGRFSCSKLTTIKVFFSYQTSAQEQL
jgi:hypothetical protein